MKKITKSALGIAGIAIIGTIALAGPANAASIGTQGIGDLNPADTYFQAGAGEVATSGFVPAVNVGTTGYSLAAWTNPNTTPAITGIVLSATAPVGTKFDATKPLKERGFVDGVGWTVLPSTSLAG